MEKQDGTVEEIVINPAQHKIETFNAEFADAQVSGIVIATSTETITNPDGSVFNVTDTELEDQNGDTYIVKQTIWDGSSPKPANGVLKSEFIDKFEQGTGIKVGTHNNTVFEKSGLLFDTGEYQLNADGSVHIQQHILNPNVLDPFGNPIILDTSPTYIVPNAELIDALQLAGGTLGNLLADQLADGDAYKTIVYKALLGTITDHFGTFGGYLLAGNNLEHTVDVAMNGEYIANPTTGTILDEPSIRKTFQNKVVSLTISTAAGIIVDEVGETLGIDGTLGGEIFNVVGDSVTTGVITSVLGLQFNALDGGVYTTLLNSGFDFGTPIFDPAFVDPDLIGPVDPNIPNTTVGESMQFQVVNAFAASAGSRLAGEVVEAENEIAAVFGSLGSTYGAAIGLSAAAGNLSFAISTAFSSSTTISNAVAAGAFGGPIGIAIGAFIGTVAGTLLGNLFGGDEGIPSSWGRIEYDPINGQYNVTTAWGSGGASQDIGQDIALQVINGVNTVLDATHGRLRTGGTALQIQVGMKGSEFEIIVNGGDARSFGTATDVINYAAFKLLKGFDLVGGHAIIMRAWHNSDAANIHEFKDDIDVAEAFQLYLSNPPGILALMMDQPESHAAQAWAAILQRAAELELHLPHEKDLDGGWGEVLLAQGVDPSLVPSLEGDTITITDPVTGEETRIHSVIGPGYEIVRIEGTNGNDIIEVIVDGPSITYVEAGEGDDLVQGSDEDDILVGGGGDDILIGQDGNDWLHGGSGEDNIDGGLGEDLIIGADHNDYLIGGGDTDTIYGNGGDDYLNPGMGTVDYVYGGEGNDTLEGSLSYGKARVQLDDAIMSENAFTISMTYKNDFSWTDDKLFHYATPGSHNSIRFYNNPVSAWLNIDGELVNTGYAGFQGTEWQTLTLSWDGSTGEVKMYDDGQLVWTHNYAAGKTLDSDGILMIGQYQDSYGDTKGNYDFNGEISRFTVWDHVLDSEEISSGPNRSDALHDFKFDKDYGMTVTNLTGNGDAVVVGDFEWVSDGASQALSLNKNGHLTAPTNAKLYGEAGNDHLILWDSDSGNGGAGDDLIEFKGSSSLALITRGGGHDTVIANTWKANTVSFDHTISLNELYFKQEGEDLKILILGENQSVTVESYFSTVNVPDIWISALGGAATMSSRASILQAVALDATIPDIPSGIYNYLSDAALAAGQDDFEYLSNPNVALPYTPWTLVSGVQMGGDGSQSFHLVSSAAQGIGGAGNDTIYVEEYTPGHKIFVGDSGNDVLVNKHGSQVGVMVGGLGNDLIIASHANDELYGGHGDDELHSNQGDDITYGGAGNDRIYGLQGNDVHNGGDGDDYIEERFGSNIIDGGRGNDTIDAHYNFGHDVIDGGEGNDVIKAGHGQDTIDAGEGADTVFAGAGDDWVSGGSGNDQMAGEAGNDVMNGGDGDDILRGGAGEDDLYGSDGADFLEGGSGNDYLAGGNGDDTYYYEGFDRFITMNPNMPTGAVWLENAALGGDAVTISMTFRDRNSVSDEHLFYYTNDNGVFEEIRIYNNPVSAWITVDGIHINTGYAGFQSTDWKTITLSWDAASGDIKLYDDAQLVFQTQIGGGRIIDNGGALSIGPEYFKGDISSFTVWDHVLDADEVTTGVDRSDALHDFSFHEGQGTTVTNLTGNGNAVVVGDFEWYADSAADESAAAQMGADIISDSSGYDTLSFGSNIRIEDLSFERDLENEDDLIIKLLGSHITTIENQFSNGTIENLKLGNQPDIPMRDLQLTLKGDESANTLVGTAWGDLLYGDGGDDLLYGGMGSDVLYGGSGADTFVFETASAFDSIDTIQDFDLSSGDRIDISDLLEGYDAETDAITAFVHMTSNGTHSYLRVDANGGADNFIQIAQITGVSGLSDEEALESSGILITA
ncbi:MAG: LamG-like jellyroll fold domain-containing protein [Alphaproteobacteria bacterium]